MFTEELSTYKIKTEHFEGPLDLLLSLVESRKLFINEISLSSVSTEYMNYVNDLMTKSDNQNIVEDISSYIVILSTLILLKTKSLLPNANFDKEEEKDIVLLERKLANYKQLKNLTREILSIFATERFFQTVRPDYLKFENKHFAPGDLSQDMISAGVSRILNNLPKQEDLHTVEIEKVMTLRERIDQVVDYLSKGNITFGNLGENSPYKEPKAQKVFQIVSFLAILELARSGILSLEQNEHFGDIGLTKND